MLAGPLILFAAFAALAAAVATGLLDGFDRTLMLAFRTADPQDPLGPAWAERLGVLVTHLGDYWTITAAAALTILFLAVTRRYATAMLVFAAVAGGALLNEILKSAFERARPDVVAHVVEVNSLSFPSGHAMSAATLYLTLGALLARTQDRPVARRAILAAAVGFAAAVGLSRVYLGVHWPSDVIGGWLAGGAWALLCWNLARRLQRRGTIERPA